MQRNINKNKSGEKIILFGYPGYYPMSELIRENMIYSLGAENYTIIDIAYPGGFKYKNLGQRLSNFFRKNVLGDKTYKLKLKFSIYENTLIDRVNELQDKVEFTFLIRPDLYPEKFIQLLRKKSKQFIIYQWNGMARFPLMFSADQYFDKVFVFDPADEKSCGNVSFITNFYFDLPEFLTPSNRQANELYYLATFDRNREKETVNFLKSIKYLPIEKNITIRKSKFKEAPVSQTNIRYISEIISYEENIRMVKSAKVLLEIVNLIHHNGLSFRAFEALCFDKKLITNNRDIRFYDFYNPQNIFIIGIDDMSQLEEFINSPYQPIEESIKQKYSFTNWIKNVLDLQPYISINPPAIN